MKLQDFSWSYNVHRLGAADIAELEQKAAQGDAEGCYMYGRYHYCVRPEPNSVSQALDLYKKALDGGVVDAKVAIAIMWSIGDLGMVDYDKYNNLLDEAINGDSGFAVMRRMLDVIMGTNGTPQSAEKAAELLEILIENDNPNTIWLYLMGRAVMESQGLAASKVWFERAAAAGFVDALGYVVLAKCYDDNWELTADYYDFLQQLNEAYAAGDGFAAYLFAYELTKEYENVATELREEYKDQLIRVAVAAFKLGYGDAAVLLGDMYLNSLCDFEYDPNEAWRWYAKGALCGNAEAFERLYDLATGDIHPEDENFCDQLAIDGARSGSAYLKEVVVELYKNGRLDIYSEEIEKYYL